MNYVSHERFAERMLKNKCETLVPSFHEWMPVSPLKRNRSREDAVPETKNPQIKKALTQVVSRTRQTQPLGSSAQSLEYIFDMRFQAQVGNHHGHFLESDANVLAVDTLGERLVL
jgi:hypothetical protein